MFLGFGYASSYGKSDCFEVVNCTCETDYFSKIKFNCSSDYGNVAVEVENKEILSINCEEFYNKESVEFYDVLPQLGESYFTNGLSLLMRFCPLPYKFSTISAKYPPIRKARFFLAQIHNVSQDFFDIDSPLTDFTFEEEVIYWNVNILLNLKNLENAELSTELAFPRALPSKLFEGNMKLRSCTMSISGMESRIPSEFFHLNNALEQVIITFCTQASQQFGSNIIEDRLLSNKINLVTVKLNSCKLAAVPAIPDQIFRNSTNLETIWLKCMGLTHLSR